MENHGNTYVGPLVIQSLIVLPEWDSSSIARIVYVISEDCFYGGTSTGWKKIKLE